MVVGILNVTPDSFYDGGRYAGREKALTHARQMIAEGANVIEIGGEKAGPGPAVSAAAEIARVLPVIEAVRGESGIPISIDTFKPEVARAAIDAGADIINSIDGFENPALRRLAAQTGAGIVVMHIQGEPRVANPYPHYRHVVEDVRAWLLTRVEQCRDDGIDPESIVIDPGPGFGKTSEHDLQIMRSLDRFTGLSYPVMLAASRKSFIAAVLGGAPDERLEGTLAVLAWGVLHGVRLVRVHDVQAAVRTVRMTEAVLRPDTAEARA